jgi:hypothetical protein
MWVFCCLALIVGLILALSPDPDRVQVSYIPEDP